ncbi:hypothetical protein L7F22_055589 [Adiantum nelumboides]|nr:hypothetical protein [Adiantum nelumboides]
MSDCCPGQQSTKEEKGKKKMQKTQVPFAITPGNTVQLSLTPELLTKYDTCIFWDTTKAPDGGKIAVTQLPESFGNLLKSEDFEEWFDLSGLTDIVSLPLNGVDLPRVYSMLENLKADGTTVIPNLQGESVEVALTENVVHIALRLPTSPIE